MSTGRRILAAAVALLGLCACTVHEPAPSYRYTAAPTSFDRSWMAAVGALQDQGVAIHERNRALGVARGTRGSINVSAHVMTQADGSVRVQFDTDGATSTDPGLNERIRQGYERRMGR